MESVFIVLINKTSIKRWKPVWIRPLSMQRVLTRHFVRDFVTRGPIKHAKIDNMCNSAANIFCDYSLSIDHINHINRFGLTNFIDWYRFIKWISYYQVSPI